MMIFDDNFLLRATAAAIGVALLAGPLGCLVTWRRMAYFGDSLSHSTLLGIVCGLLLGMPLHLGVIATCLAFALLLAGLQHSRLLTSDTLLGILSHTFLASGVLAASFAQLSGLDLHSYLFGDILAVQIADLYWIYAIALLVIAILWRYWEQLILLIFDEELACAEGVHCVRLNLLLILMLALSVAVTVRIIGVLLISTMLIVPAATARLWPINSPGKMALAATLIAMTAVLSGLAAALYFDSPSGPSIVLAAVVLFALSWPLSIRRA